MMRALCLLLLAASIAVSSGCNTVRGMGRDVEAVGEAIQRTTR
jgi:predicted small secreted protein